MKIKAFDNIFLIIFFLFLPFSYALTFNIGFPLKVSEIAVLIIIILMFINPKISISFIKTRPSFLLLIFILYTTMSTLINLGWHYDYVLNNYEARFGYAFDSILKLVYIYIAYFALIITANAVGVKSLKYNSFIVYGAVAAGFFTWYLLIFSFLKWPIIILPGMDEHPQLISLSLGSFIRCGTFREGNYMGAFLLISAIIAFYIKKTKSAWFLIISILATFSASAMLGALVFFLIKNFKNYFKLRYIFRFVGVLLIIVFTILILLQNLDFKRIIVDKVIPSKDFNYSRMDRINSISNSIKIAFNNPILGVGLSNYALHYNHYNKLKKYQYSGLKVIPNNVYAEILSETGFVGLILFILFLLKLYIQTNNDDSGTLSSGFFASCVILLAFPSFTLLFFWVFWGLIISLQTTSVNEGNNN